MLKSHAEIAIECSIPPANCMVIENGDVLEFNSSSASVIDHIDLKEVSVPNRR